MKLFYQLSEKEQNDVLHHCANLVLQDMLEGGLRLDPITEEEQLLKNRIEDAINHIKDLPTKEEKTNYLLGDSTVSKAIYEMALEMAKSAFYHEEDEMVIFPSALKQEEVEDNLLPPVNTKKSKKVSSLN